MRRATLTSALCLAAAPALGAEGAASHYLPGAGGDMLLAVAPQPGLTVANTVWYQSGDVGGAVLGGEARDDLDLEVVLNLAAASFTSETPVLGGRYTIAAMVPFGRADLSASLTGPNDSRIDRSGDRIDLSDAAFVPIQLNWNTGAFFWEAAHTIIAPTGGYDAGRAINLGRNYWSFDTAAAVTWYDPESGREVSIAPGIMLNTENPATDYRTGAEFHIDFTATQFVSPSLAVGLRGYWYRQVTGDSGAGAKLGDFKSESVVLGAGFLGTPDFAEGRLSVLAGAFATFTPRTASSPTTQLSPPHGHPEMAAMARAHRSVRRFGRAVHSAASLIGCHGNPAAPVAKWRNPSCLI